MARRARFGRPDPEAIVSRSGTTQALNLYAAERIAQHSPDPQAGA
jgi:hypothetical protein